MAQTVKNLPAVQRPGFNPWVGKIPWRRKWQPTPVFLPGESHGQRSLVGYSPRGHRESKTERLSLSLYPRWPHFLTSRAQEPRRLVHRHARQIAEKNSLGEIHSFSTGGSAGPGHCAQHPLCEPLGSSPGGHHALRGRTMWRDRKNCNPR